MFRWMADSTYLDQIYCDWDEIMKSFQIFRTQQKRWKKTLLAESLDNLDMPTDTTAQGFG